MLKTLLKQLLISLLAIFVLVPAGRALAYTVSGVVEFSYRDYETKVGGIRTHDYSWTQNYSAALQDYLFDPRVMKFRTSIGYSVISKKSHPYSSGLTYDLAADFFPGMKVSADAHAKQSISTFYGNDTISGYDVETTSYGGTLRFNLSKPGRKNNNNTNSNNNNNNNNNTSSKSSLVLPDITLSQNHTDSKSLSALNPYHDTLDTTGATLFYRPNAAFDLNLNGGIDKFHNLTTNSSYENKTANFTSNAALSKDVDFRMDGRLTERTTHDVFSSTTGSTESDKYDKSWTYNALLDFKEKDRLHHFYKVSANNEQSTGVNASAQAAEAGMTYKILEELQFVGGINYRNQEYVQKATAVSADTKYKLETEGLQSGLAYGKAYRPDFLGPFTLRTNYAFNVGYSRYSSDNDAATGGGGYYTNTAGLGISSTGWQKEVLTLDYAYSNKRDLSPLKNMTESQSVRLNFLTRRITRTTIRALASYLEQKNSSAITSVLLSNTAQGQRNRTLTYDLSADYSATDYITLSAGATRGEQRSNTYTLATAYFNTVNSNTDDIVFGNASLNYPVTRNLMFRLTGREEKHHTITNSKTTNWKRDTAGVNIDYRIRQVFVNIESKWQMDTPNDGQKTEQTYSYIKISRPF